MKKENQDNFLQRSKSNDLSLTLLSTASWTLLSITTAAFIMPIAHNALAAHLTGTWLYAATLLTAYITYLIIDFRQGALVTHVMKERHISRMLKEKHGRDARYKDHKRYVNQVSTLLFVRLIVTVSLSIWASHQIVDNFTPESAETEILVMAQDNIHAQNAKETAALSAFQDLQKSEPERIEAAQNKGKRLVAAAVAAGTRWQRDSYRKLGFGWIENRVNPDRKDHSYAAAIRAAQDQAAQLVEAERGRSGLAYSAVTGAQTDTTLTALNTALLAKANREQTKREAKVSNYTGYLYIADILAVILGLWVCKIRVQRMKAGGAIFEEGRNIFSTLAAAWKIRTDAALDELENLLGMDINGDGKIGTQTTNGSPQKNGSTAYRSASGTQSGYTNGSGAVNPLITNAVPAPRPFSLPNRSANGSQSVKAERFCVNCSADISMKKSNAKYCSPSCKNAARYN